MVYVYYGCEMKKGEMNRACGMLGAKTNAHRVLLKMDRSERLDYLGVDGRIILN
jgi:hypothetical protein